MLTPSAGESYEYQVHDVYPLISPETLKGSHSGKVVFITGGGSGLGLASAKAYAQSGAKVFIVGRRLPVLETAKVELEALGAEVGIAQVDVMQQDSVKKGVATAVEKFGRIDVVIANAGGLSGVGEGLKDVNADDWWAGIEINLKTAFLTAKETLPELMKTGNGYMVLVTSGIAQIRAPAHSSYNIPELGVNRLADYIDIEYRDSGVKAFAVHPGNVQTDLAMSYIDQFGLDATQVCTDTPELGAWTQVRLTSGSHDWLSGRYFAASWGFEQIDLLKEKIITEDALKNRLVLA